MAERTLAHEKIEVVWKATPEAVLADEAGNARALQVKLADSRESIELPCKGSLSLSDIFPTPILSKACSNETKTATSNPNWEVKCAPPYPVFLPLETASITSTDKRSPPRAWVANQRLKRNAGWLNSKL